MKKLFVILLCSAGLASTQANAQKFNFKGGDVHDFGTVMMGPDVTYKFEFTNTGDKPLIIQDANPSCSCTVSDFPKQPILPGKQGVITVGFHTKDHAGPFGKDVFIQSNATNNPNGEKRYTIHIKGVVKDPHAPKG